MSQQDSRKNSRVGRELKPVEAGAGVPDGGLPAHRKKQAQKSMVRVEFEGKRHSASYFVTSRTVTVKSKYGSTTFHVGGLRAKPEFIAGLLFREILGTAKSRGEL